jgi:hypothetical protein
MQYLNTLFQELTPEYGLGYSMGIVGGCLMLLLLVYPLKKRLGFIPLPFSTRFWFRIHMMLGVFGPLTIFAHSKLNLGSTNSSVAFWFMTTIMLSGLVGRYLYQKIHMGLYGRRKLLDDLLLQVDERVAAIASDGVRGEHLARKATYLRSLIPTHGSISNLITQRRKIRNTLKIVIESSLNSSTAQMSWLQRRRHNRQNRQQTELIHRVDRALGDCISFRLYEKLFSWWHVLHLPIFFAFLLATIVHIWAVHVY